MGLKAKFESMFPRVASLYRTLRDEIKSWSQGHEMTPMGFLFSGDRSMQQGFFEPVETRAFTGLLNRVEVVLNVGANVGYYVCIALKHKKKVVAFEPLSSNYKKLLSNVYLNNYQKDFVLYPVALSDGSSSIVKMFGAGTGASTLSGWANNSLFQNQLVSCSSLDEVLGQKLKGQRVLILIDVEGAEFPVLDGANVLMTSEPKPIWMVEVVIREHHPDLENRILNATNIFERFWEAGYVARKSSDVSQVVSREVFQRILSGEDPEERNYIFVSGDVCL